MAAFQGWAAGPNFSGAAQNMAQAVQVEEQRQARQSKQLQEVFKGIGDNRRRKEDQAIAAATAETAQKNKVSDRAVNVFTALNNTASRLAGQKPTPNDYVLTEGGYEAAISNWKAAVSRNQAQMSQIVANNPALKDMLGAQGAQGAPPTTTTTTGNPIVPTYMMAPDATPSTSPNTNSLNENLAESTGRSGDNADSTGSDGNLFDRAGRYLGGLGGVAADLTQKYNPNSSAEEEQGFFKKAAEFGLDAKSLYNEYTKNKANMPEVGLGTQGNTSDTAGGVDNTIPGFENGSIFGMGPADLSGGNQTDIRGDTPESNRQAVQSTIFDALKNIPDVDLPAAWSSISDAVSSGITKVAPEGFAKRLKAFGESNLEGRERSQEVFTLKEMAKKSAEGAVVGIAGAMAVITSGALLSTIIPGKRQVVKQARIDYKALLKRIKRAASQRKLDAAQAKIDKRDLARAAKREGKPLTRRRGGGQATRIPRTPPAEPGPQATFSGYPGRGRFNPLP